MVSPNLSHPMIGINYLRLPISGRATAVSSSISNVLVFRNAKEDAFDSLLVALTST